MLGPVPVPAPFSALEVQPLPSLAPAQAETADNPRQPVDNRQPVELPLDRVDPGSETRGLFAESEEMEPPKIDPPELPDAPNAGVTFRILKELSHQIQSRVVDRHTREVLRSVPPDQLVDFYARFREAGERLDLEA